MRSKINADLVGFLRCPKCRFPLERRLGTLECKLMHSFPCDGPYIVFAPDADQGKYDQSYSERYAFLWAYGYETRNSGLVESLYRSVGSLIAEALAETSKDAPVIVDCGCGTGRSISATATLTPSGRFLGIDLSFAKLDLAARILMGTTPIQGALPDYGFTNRFVIRGRGLTNVLLAQADALALPLEDGSADLVLSVNLLDRVPDPRAAIHEARRVLRPGGALVLTTPLNWTNARLWDDYPDATAMSSLLVSCGFSITTWFDQLLYREILDARGSVEEFTTFVASGRAI